MGGHTFSNNLYHVIFGTHQRRPWLIDAAIREELHCYLSGVTENLHGILLKACSTADHIHLLVKLRPAVAESDFVRDIKSNSSGWIHKKFPGLAGFAWQEGFGSFTVSHSLTGKVRGYIERQEEHHKKRGFAEELAEFLKKNGIEYDPLHYLD